MSSGCGDVLSLEDLKTAKKHQLFEAEVITGKQGGVASGADIDYATNQVTGQTQKTLPAILRDLGFEPASFDFTTGGTLGVNDRNKVVYDPVSKTWYSWGGALPHVIAAGTNPVGVADWTPQTDPNLRNDLASVITPGTNLIGTKLGINLSDYLNRVFVPLDTIVPSVDGSSDCAAAINAAIASASTGKKTVFKGTPGSIYRVDSTISLVGVSNVEIDFSWATLNDNVQGVITTSANRPNHTILIYNSHNITVKNVNVNELSTRTFSSGGAVPPMAIVWVGTNYDSNDYPSSNILIDGLVVTNTRRYTMPFAIIGESFNGKVRNVEIKGDASYGINFEYGDIPEDPAVNPTWTNGKHPYNWEVENFNGSGLLHCEGFLRVASCFNIKFTNCTGYNVSSFIYCYSGDRNISRVSENVIFDNCKNKNNSADLTVANNCVWIIIVNKDGSTGAPLPSWTNYSHSFTFNSCEFWNNDAAGGACVRFQGNKGKTVFNNSIFKNSPLGVNAVPAGNPDYVSDYSLTLNDCQFIGNLSDVYAANINGVAINRCTFKEQSTVSTKSQIVIDGTNKGISVRDSLFMDQRANRPFIETTALTSEFSLTNNEFRTQSVGYVCLLLGRQAKGHGNFTNGILLSAASKKIYGQKDAEIKNITSPGVWNFEDATQVTITGSVGTVTSVTGGKAGDVLTISGITGSASYTLANASGSVATGDRILTKTGADSGKSGRITVQLLKQSDGWYEI